MIDSLIYIFANISNSFEKGSILFPRNESQTKVDFAKLLQVLLAVKQLDNFQRFKY